MFQGMTLKDAREKSFRRKLLEVWVALIITTRASKDEILEMYLNDMPLGQRGSFAIVGVPEAARLFFGKDVSNVTLAEAATIAGVYPVAVRAVAVQQPGALQGAAQRRAAGDGRRRLRRRRRSPTAPSHEPLIVVQRALEAEAPYFVDYVGQTLADQYPGLTTTTTQAVDVYTTLDLHLQRLAQDAVRDGLTRVDQLLSRRKRRGKAEAALIAVDPRTGEILAFVGGRSYNQSQYNRAIVSRRQPGSVFKPFVYLAAFEEAAAGRTHGHHAGVDHRTTSRRPSSSTIRCGRRRTTRGEYDGPITFRHALAHSRNLGDDPRRAGRRLRSRRRVLEDARARQRAEGVSVDRARRVRGDAVRDRHGVHAVPERRRDAAAEAHPRINSGGKDVTKKDSARAADGRAAGHDVPRHEHDAQRAERRHRRRARAGRASRSTPRARPARPTICATPGSSASRPSC